MASEPDHYVTLGVARDAAHEQIVKAYRAMSKKHHPDRSKDADAGQRMAEINKAYSVLSDPERRRNYDEFGSGENPIHMAAIDTLRKKVAEYLDAFDGDLVASLKKWIDERQAEILFRRPQASRDLDRAEKARRRLKYKGSDQDIFEAVFTERAARIQNAIESMDKLERILKHMRTILADYESGSDPLALTGSTTATGSWGGFLRI